eukprot:10283940-Prorocentrum_lima.AAC.1
MWSGQATFNNTMLDGIHTLSRFDDALNGFEYTSVQVSVSEEMIPRRGAYNLGRSWTLAMGKSKED